MRHRLCWQATLCWITIAINWEGQGSQMSFQECCEVFRLASSLCPSLKLIPAQVSTRWSMLDAVDFHLYQGPPLGPDRDQGHSLRSGVETRAMKCVLFQLKHFKWPYHRGLHSRLRTRASSVYWQGKKGSLAFIHNSGTCSCVQTNVHLLWQHTVYVTAG